MTTRLDASTKRIENLQAKLRKLKAEKRRQDRHAALLADAQLGQHLRQHHPELTKLLAAAVSSV